MHTQSPATTPATRPALPKLKLVLHSLSLLAAALVANGFWSSLPAFADVFSSFGAELPLLTQLVVDYPQAVWNILRSGLAHQLAWLLLWIAVRERWAHIGLLLASLVAWLLVALQIVAVYLPIFSLSTVV
ncbi:hypothetical protein HNE05_11385 [Aquipseudomonas campi]|uniref:Uncharacterized protein n=1 Tax=Aquipseudomonas campi TaxID=2731681 RepID=A0A6M8FGN2_9GAMM|nr:hypothetical protein [Pseudomonas campi]QKE63927.1 hypothetical protein HNE05_11385 [Pseudomonas campi]